MRSVVPELAPAPRRVLLATDPLDARVLRSGQDLGMPPLTVEVPAGETVTVDVEHEGYRPRTVEVDGSSLELRIKLGRLPATPKPPASSSPRTTRIGGVVVVNPWAP